MAVPFRPCTEIQGRSTTFSLRLIHLRTCHVTEYQQGSGCLGRTFTNQEWYALKFLALYSLFQGLRFLIQHKTVIESTQNMVSYFRGKGVWTVLAKRTRIVAPSSSCHFSLQGNPFYINASILINGANINACSVSLFWSVTETVKFSWLQIARRAVKKNTLVYKDCWVFEAQEWVISISSSDHLLTGCPNWCVQ